MYEVPSSVHYLGSRPFLYLSLQFCAKREVCHHLRPGDKINSYGAWKQTSANSRLTVGPKPSPRRTHSFVRSLESKVTMSAFPSSSLRDMYAPSQTSWSFAPSQSNSTLPSAVASNVPQTSYEWSTRPPTNPIFDLSSSLSLTEPSGVEIKLLLKGLIAGAVLQYTSTALAMPFEVGKLLLQVQWVPRDLSLLGGPTVREEEYEEEAEVMASLFFKK